MTRLGYAHHNGCQIDFREIADFRGVENPDYLIFDLFLAPSLTSSIKFNDGWKEEHEMRSEEINNITNHLPSE